MTHVWVAAMSLLQEMEGLLKVILEDTAAKDLNARQVHVLGELYRENGQSAKNLAIAVALPTNSSTWFIDNLIIAGMVERGCRYEGKAANRRRPQSARVSGKKHSRVERSPPTFDGPRGDVVPPRQSRDRCNRKAGPPSPKDHQAG